MVISTINRDDFLEFERSLMKKERQIKTVGVDIASYLTIGLVYAARRH